MVKIRLKRMGTKKRPVYRLVVADSRSPRDGRFIEAIGFYDPLPNPAVVRIDEEKVRTWMRKGARPSDSARYLLVQQGILAAQPRRVAAEGSGPDAQEGAAAGAHPAPSPQEGAAPESPSPEPAADAEGPAPETAAPAEAQVDGAEDAQ